MHIALQRQMQLRRTLVHSASLPEDAVERSPPLARGSLSESIFPFSVEFLNRSNLERFSIAGIRQRRLSFGLVVSFKLALLVFGTIGTGVDKKTVLPWVKRQLVP